MDRVVEVNAKQLSEYCYCHYGDRLYSTAWALLSPPCVGLYRDVVHEAFLVFQRQVRAGRIRFLRSNAQGTADLRRVGPRSCRYLAKVVMHKCAHTMDRETQRLLVNEAYAHAFACSLAEPTDDCCCRQELRGLVRSALEQLPESQRIVLTLRELTGLSYDNISEDLGLPKRTIETRLRRSREALRNQLASIEGLLNE